MIEPKVDFILGFKVNKGFDFENIQYKSSTYDIFDLCEILTDEFTKMKVGNDLKDLHDVFKNNFTKMKVGNDLKDLHDVFKNNYKIGYSVSFYEDILSDYIVGIKHKKDMFDYGYFHMFDSCNLFADFNVMKILMGCFKKEIIDDILMKIFPLEDDLKEYMLIGIG